MTLYFSPQGKVEELEEAVGEAEVAEAEAGGVARESHPALVVDVRSHLPTEEETSSNTNTRSFTQSSNRTCCILRHHHNMTNSLAHRGYPGGRHLLEEALRAGGVEAVDGVPAVLLRAQLDRLHVLVAVLADLQRTLQHG